MSYYTNPAGLNYDTKGIFPVARALSVLPIATAHMEIDYFSRDETINTVKAFVNDNFNFHKVFSLDKSSSPYKSLVNDSHKREIYVKSVIDNLVLVDPFDLTIRYNLDDFMEGATNARSFNFGESCNIYLSIDLPRQITTLTPSTYLHELVHTQLDDLCGIKYLFNDELFPIFLELLFIKDWQRDMNLYRADLNFRIHDLARYAATLDDLERGRIPHSEDAEDYCFKYSASILQAFQLMALYERGSSTFKKRMLRNIQEIFDLNIMVEDFLDIYGINLSNMTDKKKLLSYLKK